jgi:hypothetical protein
MANRKISEFTALTQPAPADVLPIVDVSEALDADKNKKITVEEIFKSIPSGTAASPGIAFESDDGNGIYLAGTDTIGISTNGTGRLFIDASGNIGIGAAATAPLDVYRTTNAELRLTTSADGYLQIGQFTNGGFIGTSSSDSVHGALRFGTAATERMRLTSAGLLGLGTSSPVGKLNVAGYSSTDVAQDIQITRSSSGTGIQTGPNLTLSTGTSTDTIALQGTQGRFGIWNYASSSWVERFCVTGPGNVGIGTNAPTTTLDCRGVISTNDALYCYNSARDGLGIWYNPGGAGVNQLTARVNGGDRLTIDGSGRVGLGTTSPSVNFEIVGTTTDAVYAGVTATNASSYSVLQVRNTGTSGRNYHIGVGGSSAASLANSFYIYDATAGAGRLVIDSSGRVGVGTTSPDKTLSIATSNGNGVLIRSGAYGTTGSNATLYLSGGGYDDGQPAGFAIASEQVSINNHVLKFCQSTANADGSSYAISTERMRIDSSGRLLVGTSTSASVGSNAPYSLLQVKGNSFSSSGPGLINLQRGEAPTAITSGEEIGKIVFSANDGSEFAIIETLADANAGSSDYPGRLVFSTTADSASSPTARMTIKSDGKVGIGTESPQGILDVVKAGGSTSPNLALISGGPGDPSSVDPSIQFGASGAESIGTTKIVSTGGYNDRALAFHTGTDGAGTERLRITSTGRVGIGTSSPGYVLDVLGSARVKTGATETPFIIATGGDSQAALRFGSTGGGGFYGIYGGADYVGLQLWTSGNQALTIDNLQRVGIGTGSPTQALSVVGSIQLGATLAGGVSGTSYSILGNGVTGGNASGGDVNVIAGAGSGSGVNGSVYISAGSTLSPASVTTGGSVFITSGKPSDSLASGTIDFRYYAGNPSTLATAMRIDSSGRVGIGTTSPTTILHLQSSAANAYLRVTNGTVDSYFGIDNANSAADIYVATTHPLRFFTNSAERARIDSSGRLLVGTSTARSNTYNASVSQAFQVEGTTDSTRGIGVFSSASNGLGGYLTLAMQRSGTIGGNTIVNNADELGFISFQGSDGTDFVEGARISTFVDGTPGANDMPGRLVFSTTADGASSPTERMRITSTGSVQCASATGGAPVLSVDNSSNVSGSQVLYLANRANANNQSSYYIVAQEPGVANRFFVLGNGDVLNANNVYGSMSDIKLKENIIDASSQWSDLKALRVRKYNFKPETGQHTHTQIGLVAQEVEVVSPGLIHESPDLDAEGNDLGTVTKSVNYSVLYMKAVKALQEAMERIEVLEQRLSDAGIA